MDTIWLAEAYPWWRKHGMEARSSTVVSALMARETGRLTIGWGIISPFTRHPVQVAMDAESSRRRPGPAGSCSASAPRRSSSTTSARRRRHWGRCATRSRSCAASSAAGRSSTWARRGARPCRLSDDAHTPRDVPPVYVAATAPKMQALAGEIADGCLTPSITTPAFVRYGEGVAADIDIGCTVVASIHESDQDEGREAPGRSQACTSRTSSRTSGAPPTRCSSSRRSRWTSWRAGRGGDGTGWASRRQGAGDGRAPRPASRSRGRRAASARSSIATQAVLT